MAERGGVLESPFNGLHVLETLLHGPPRGCHGIVLALNKARPALV